MKKGTLLVFRNSGTGQYAVQNGAIARYVGPGEYVDQEHGGTYSVEWLGVTGQANGDYFIKDFSIYRDKERIKSLTAKLEFKVIYI